MNGEKHSQLEAAEEKLQHFFPHLLIFKVVCSPTEPLRKSVDLISFFLLWDYESI